jgi:hypothetical protein
MKAASTYRWCFLLPFSTQTTEYYYDLSGEADADVALEIDAVVDARRGREHRAVGV